MKRKVFASLILTSAILISCDKKDDSSSNGTNFLPLISPAVEKAQPSGLSSASLMSQEKVVSMATSPNAQEALNDFFKDNVNSISGYTKSGLIKTYLFDLDKRIEEISSRPEPTCLSNTPVEVPFITGVSGHEVTLKLQCATPFGGAGDQSGAGSGLAYGKDENFIYIYLMLSQASNTNDKFGYAVKMDRVTENVDLLFLQRSVTYTRNQFFHLVTNPSEKRYEIVYASTSGAPGPAQTQTTHVFDPGVRLVATEGGVRAEGTVAQTTTAAGAAQGTTGSFDANECFSATDLTAAPVTCDSNAPTFSTAMTLVLATALPNKATTIADSLKTMTELISLGVQQAD